MSVLASEQLVGYWQERYIRGAVSLDVMEREIERALSGQFSDEDWVRAAIQRHLHPNPGPVYS
jgi:hypothetical protein